MLEPMRIDPKGKLAGYPCLLVRDTLRRLKRLIQFPLTEVGLAARLETSQGRALARALVTEGLIQDQGDGFWTVTQAGVAFSSATAAKRVTRKTAEAALRKFLARVEQVNNDSYFLGQVTRVVLFGSMLDRATERPSDVDVAVEATPREKDFDRARMLNYARAQELANQGHRFRNFLDQEDCWRSEIFRFLKGRDRVIALADYRWEKEFILQLPHRVLLGVDEEPRPATPGPRKKAAKPRRPSDCPF